MLIDKVVFLKKIIEMLFQYDVTWIIAGATLIIILVSERFYEQPLFDHSQILIPKLQKDATEQ